MTVQPLLGFLREVASDFRGNQGLLLAGAVAYYALLSIVPLALVMLVLLSHVVDEHMLLNVVIAHLNLLLPGQAAGVSVQIRTFLENRPVVGIVGGVALLFFSSLAFTVLENAMSVIFYHRVAIQRRHFLTSAILPYLFITLLAIGLLASTIISSVPLALAPEVAELLGYAWSPEGVTGALIYVLGVLGHVVVLTAMYLVLPAGQVPLRHALVGGTTAAVLWEGVRVVLVWYFSSFSMVRWIYGSLATTVVVLLMLEAGAMILLLGAQIIATLERRQAPPEGPRTRRGLSL